MKKRFLTTVVAAFAVLSLNVTGMAVYADEEDIPEAVEELVDENEMEINEKIYTIKTEDREEVNLYFSWADEYMGSEISINVLDPYFPDLDGQSGEYYSSADNIPLSENEILETAEFEYTNKDGITVKGRKFYILSIDPDDPDARYAGHEVFYREKKNAKIVTITSDDGHDFTVIYDLVDGEYVHSGGYSYRPDRHKEAGTNDKDRFTDDSFIPLNDNEQLFNVVYTIDKGAEKVRITKYYIACTDYNASYVKYAGFTEEPLETSAPNTGNIPVKTAGAVLVMSAAVMSVCGKSMRRKKD